MPALELDTNHKGRGDDMISSLEACTVRRPLFRRVSTTLNSVNNGLLVLLNLFTACSCLSVFPIRRFYAFYLLKSYETFWYQYYASKAVNFLLLKTFANKFVLWVGPADHTASLLLYLQLVNIRQLVDSRLILPGCYLSHWRRILNFLSSF